MSLRPLRKRRSGEWLSRDGRFLFIDGYQAGAYGMNGEAWHIYDLSQGPEATLEAWGDREPTLRDAVAQVALYVYPDERST